MPPTVRVPCFCCGVEFDCSREHVSIVRAPPQPLCTDCCPLVPIRRRRDGVRLYEAYRPRTLREIVGQPSVRYLRMLASHPRSTCLVLEGPPGCGKTAAGYALAHELGCFDADTWPTENAPECALGNNTGLFTVIGSELSVDKARDLFMGSLRLRYGSSSGYRVLILEELERISPQCQVFLKTALETQLPQSAIVVATSNDMSGLSKALRQRFKRYEFSGGEEFSRCAAERIRRIWNAECPGLPLPEGFDGWGWDGEKDQSYSLRLALDVAQDHLDDALIAAA